jgi:ComF family protein
MTDFAYPTPYRSWLLECLEVILPTQCLVCARPLRGPVVCYRCRPPLPPITDISVSRCTQCFEPCSNDATTCEACKLYPILPDSIRFIWEYDGLARDLIRTMKYKPSLKLLALCSELINRAAPLFFPTLEWDLIVPVPSSPTQLRRRLLHPCVELSRNLARSQTLKINSTLYHQKSRRPQASLSHEERLRSLLTIFALRAPHTVRGKRILLIEDVITTGATISAATYQLRQAGAARIDVLALARTRVWRRFRARLHSIFPEKSAPHPTQVTLLP